MDSIASLTQFVAALDTPSKAIVGVLALLGAFAFKFFPEKTPATVRLAVFSVMAALGGGAMWLLHASALASAREARPSAEARPSPAPGVSWRLPALVGVAHAASAEGWVFVGRWDEKRNVWLEGPDVDGAGGRPPGDGQELTARRSLDVYADQPRFNAFSQRWSLAARTGTIGKGTRLKAAGASLVIGKNVWVRVTDLR